MYSRNNYTVKIENKVIRNTLFISFTISIITLLILFLLFLYYPIIYIMIPLFILFFIFPVIIMRNIIDEYFSISIIKN